MFNIWRRYPRRKPKSSGHYLCTVAVWDGEDRERFYVTKLYYKSSKNCWIDSNRQSVFDGYNVYKVCRAPIEDNHVYADSMCNRTDDVRAWKKLPRCYRWWRKEN